MLRQNPLTGEWVIITSKRARRPEIFAHNKDERQKANYKLNSRKANCPFCPGNEHLTPPEVLTCYPDRTNLAYAYACKDSPDYNDSSKVQSADSVGENNSGNGEPWAVRVVPNRLPALERNQC